ncbi:MAG: 6-phosphogluconolactonase [Patescibacteria group bacterium]|jgi:6-phosphogluconolactonase/glucosamine-6-phosphate isomerase/deaminase|nr:6-phosphogluconolactonase [Patescibacteria group bacterium]
MDEIKKILSDQHALFDEKMGITVIRVPLIYEGFKLTKEILQVIADRKTVLYLSGGRTPKGLYENLAQDQKLFPGALALIDERYGSKFHNNSNEKMIKDTGLLPMLSEKGVPFYPILLEEQKDLDQTAKNYDMTLKYLFAGFPKSVGILGIGLDGHTAGIAGNRKGSTASTIEAFENPLFTTVHPGSLVGSFSDLKGPFKERITMTFMGLSMLDLFIVLVFGEDKKNALELVFSDGPEEEVPGRFFRRPEIARRTIFITDQKV